MTSIILPRRALVQPQGAEILSASDGTWQAEFVHGFANGADLTGHGYTLQTGTSVVHEAYERGVRAYINNHAAGAAADIAISRGLYVAASEPFFSVVQYRTDSGSDGSGGLLCLRNTSANPICSMFVGPNGITGLAGSATFIVRDSSGSLSRHETTTAVNDGLMHTSAVRRFNGRWQWSLDGSPWANFATSPTNAQGAITFTPDRMFYGREPTGTAIGNVFQGFFEFGMVGRGTLNDAQIATVHQNPWLLFKQSPRRLYFDVPAGAATVQADGTIRWSLVSSVQATQALRWSLSAAVKRDTSLLWSLLASVQADTTAHWSLIKAINADAALRWGLVKAVQSDAALSWMLLSTVSADSTLLWDLAGALGVVSADLELRWSALAPVSASAELHWHILNAVARDIAFPWNAVQAIAADNALRWALVQALQADLTAAWRMVTAVSADSVLAWDLAAALGVVGASLDLRWSLIARVQQAVDARWSLLASVGADADMRWDIVAGVMRELTLRWDSVATLVAENTLDLSWSLIAVSETDLLIRWQVGEVFDLVVRKRFVAGASTRRVFVTGASTCRSFVA